MQRDYSTVYEIVFYAYGKWNTIDEPQFPLMKEGALKEAKALAGTYRHVEVRSYPRTERVVEWSTKENNDDR